MRPRAHKPVLARDCECISGDNGRTGRTDLTNSLLAKVQGIGGRPASGACLVRTRQLP